MTDKTPLQSDHGASLFHHAKDSARRNGKGHPRHQPGESAEHVKAPPPELPWARSERVEPKTSDTGWFVVPGAVPASNAKRPAAPTAEPGRTLLGSPDHTTPKRRVGGSDHRHEEHRPAHLRRAKLQGAGSLSAKLKSELMAADRANRTARNDARRAAQVPKPSASPADVPGPQTMGSEY